MPMEIHEDKIIMRAGKYNLPKCCCGEPWRLNTVHREKTPCFDYIEHEWVGLTEDERTAIRAGVQTYLDMTQYEYGKAVQQATELKLKEKNHA